MDPSSRAFRSEIPIAGLCIPVFGSVAQFYDESSKIGFALSTTSNGDLLFQVSAPTSSGWGAIGTGDKMDGSLMFIIYPSSLKYGTV